MDNQSSIFDRPSQQFPIQRPLPNATAVLVLGIISIVVCGIGIITGIIALVLGAKDMRLYNLSPEVYTEGSLKNLKAGRICAIVGVVLGALAIIYYVAVFSYLFYSFNATR